MVTFEELLAHYFFVRELREATQKSYTNSVKALTDFCGKVLLSEVDNTDVLNWRKALLEKGTKPVTWNFYARHLKALYHFALDYGLARQNPFVKVALPVTQKSKKTLNTEQLKQIEELMQKKIKTALQDNKIRHQCTEPAWFWLTVIQTFQLTGIRLNQLLHIRYRDVDLTKKILYLCSAGSKTHREYSVPVAEKLLPVLSYLMDMASKKQFEPHEQLFNVNRFSEAFSLKEMNSDQVERFFKHLSKLCGFIVSPHRFRHTIATELMKNPERNLHIAKALLGHSDIKTTLEYIETDAEQIRKCIDHLANEFYRRQ